MGKLVFLPCVALLIAAAPANSAPPAVTNQVTPSDSEQAVSLSGGRAGSAVEEKKICKQLPETGTRVAKRACLTASEWKQLEAELEQ
jgi:hypothetical protein